MCRDRVDCCCNEPSFEQAASMLGYTRDKDGNWIKIKKEGLVIYLVEGLTNYSRSIVGCFLKEEDARQCAEDKTKAFENAKWPDAKWQYRVKKLRVLESYKGIE